MIGGYWGWIGVNWGIFVEIGGELGYIVVEFGLNWLDSIASKKGGGEYDRENGGHYQSFPLW